MDNIICRCSVGQITQFRRCLIAKIEFFCHLKLETAVLTILPSNVWKTETINSTG